jgi:hypothetical protein
MDDGSGLAEALLGLDGFSVLAVSEGPEELVITVETAAQLVGCGRCGTRAEAQDHMPIDIRDLTCFGRPARLVWIKRRWRCTDADCDARTWTERSDHVDAQAVLTRRAQWSFTSAPHAGIGASALPLMSSFPTPSACTASSARETPSNGPHLAGERQSSPMVIIGSPRDGSRNSR